MYSNYQPLQAYSLADLFRDINNGHKNEFTYNETEFKVKRIGLKWVVSYGELTAESPYCGAMINLQGMAACLLYYKRSLVFNRAGDIIN